MLGTLTRGAAGGAGRSRQPGATPIWNVRRDALACNCCCGTITCPGRCAIVAVLPLAKVGGRRHTPVNALVVMGLGSIAALWFYTRPGSPFKTLTGIFGFILSFCLTSAAAILLPFRQREAWKNSPVNWRLGKVPVVTIAGVLSLVAAGFMGCVYLHDPLSGITWKPAGGGGILFHSRSFDMFLLNIVILLSGLVIYLVARLVQRRRGVDLDATYREIPVE